MPPEPKSEQRTALQIALDYALHGLPVFPCVPLTKRPYTSNGFKAATRDADQIKTWWQQWPDAMIGCPMGEESGLYCVDLDIDKETGEMVGEGAAIALGIYNDLQTGVRATTHSGGSHFYFTDPGEGFGNTASKIADRIDTRGKGGYTILPGSVTSEGKAYRWDFLGLLEVGLDNLPELPDSIIDALQPKTPDVPLSQQASPEPRGNILDINLGTPIAPGAGSEAAWAAKALDLECNALATTPEGKRNHQLNTSAFSLAQIVAAGHLDEQLVRTRLMDAATACGLIASDGLEQCRATFSSGWTAGYAQPRSPKSDDTWPSAPPEIVAPTPEPAPPSTQDDVSENAETDTTTQDTVCAESDTGIPVDPAFPAWTVKDLSAIPRVEFVYSDFFARGYTSLTVAPPKVGKSMLALSEAIDIASGRGLFSGIEQPKRKVLYFNAEDDQNVLDNRIAALLTHYGMDQKEIAGWLYPVSGVDWQGFFFTYGDLGAVHEPVFAIIERLIRREGIDISIFDPLQDMSDAPETNDVFRRMGRRLRKLAVDTDTSIGLVHHTRKVQPGAELTIDDARGGSALRGTARFNRILAPMTDQEAAKAGLDNHRWYMRIGDMESNLAPPSAEINQWFRKVSVECPNGERIGALEKWQWPDAFDGVTPEHAALVRNIIDRMEEPPRADIRAKAWIGNIICDALGMNPSEKSDKSKAASIVKKWIETDVLRVEQDRDHRAGRDIDIIICGANDPMNSGGTTA